ncbi:MAG TPA: hypothetical protein VMF09_10280 [Solirubrobacteraceae bacterium]|nr:hypothetical protein [Solirubrobacteraceae bacterium]
MTTRASVNPFPSYRQMPQRVPAWAWRIGRLLAFGSAVALCVLLVVKPDEGLELWWKLAVPLLPLVWLVAPGLWRNVCPLAAANQTPRLLGFTHSLSAPGWYRRYAPAIGMTALILLIASRKLLFNTSGIATCVLISASLAAAIVGGILFKGKSGWCSMICPLLPVQRMYGQTPSVTVPNAYCRPCVACTKNCYDFNPATAYLADLYEEDRFSVGARKFFAGCFPGLILGYFTLPDHVSGAHDFGDLALCLSVSAGSLFLAEAALKVSVGKIAATYAGLAISLYYWYASQVLAGTLTGSESTGWFVWGLRAVVWTAAAVWLARTWRKEVVYRKRVVERAPRAAG